MAEPNQEAERLIREAIAAVRFGTVTVTIHDARVVQVERTEKVRVPERGGR